MERLFAGQQYKVNPPCKENFIMLRWHEMRYDMLAVIKQARKRRKEALRLRNQGLTLQQIADLWDISRARVQYIVEQAKKEALGR